MTQLLEYFNNCGSLGSEIQQMQAWNLIFGNPLKVLISFVFNMMTNIALIAVDMIYIVEAMIYEDYTSMGIHFGYMVSDTFKEPDFDKIDELIE